MKACITSDTLQPTNKPAATHANSMKAIQQHIIAFIVFMHLFLPCPASLPGFTAATSGHQQESTQCVDKHYHHCMIQTNSEGIKRSCSALPHILPSLLLRVYIQFLHLSPTMMFLLLHADSLAHFTDFTVLQAFLPRDSHLGRLYQPAAGSWLLGPCCSLRASCHEYSLAQLAVPYRGRQDTCLEPVTCK
jgi:hypothetical protein